MGCLSPRTWESKKRQCLYVGNRQGGSSDEVDSPNDPVIQGRYTDYVVNDTLGTEFEYTHFDSSRCSIESTTSPPENTTVPPESTTSPENTTPLPESTTAHAENSNVVAIASAVAAVGSVMIIFIAIVILVVNVVRRHQAQFHLHKEDR